MASGYENFVEMSTCRESLLWEPLSSLIAYWTAKFGLVTRVKANSQVG